MKKASIISIGNELLSGDGLDTNSRWLSKQLLLMGIPTVSISIVGDDISMISDAIGQAASYAEIILITGGLGPTEDDLTRYAVADFLGAELTLRDKVFRQMLHPSSASLYSLREGSSSHFRPVAKPGSLYARRINPLPLRSEL